MIPSRDSRNVAKKLENAEVKKLSQLLTEGKGKQELQKAYLKSFSCYVEYGDPTLSEFLSITQKARQTGDVDNYIFDLIIAMLQKGDPKIDKKLWENIDGAQALEILEVMVKESPFFKRLFELQKEGTLMMR